MSVTGRDLKILLVLGVLALAAGYWLLLLSPLREKAAEAAARAQTEQQRLTTAQSQLTVLRAAKATYAADYATVVRLGKAIPTSVDTASLMIQLQDAADGTEIRFTAIEAGERTAATAAPPQSLGSAAAAEEGKKSGGPAPAPPASPAQESAAAERDSALADRENTPAARQAAADGQAQAPSASTGLEQVPLEFTFNGSFFDLADFFHEMKRFVSVSNQKIDVSGRLMTIDKLSFAPKPDFPHIEALVTATAYVSPKAEGLTAGATPAGPASVPASGADPGAQPPAPAAAAPAPTAAVKP
jgi:Tfp pilus assembly protein PilO